MKRIEYSKVLANRQIARGIWRMEMEAPAVASQILGPGQFINICVSESWDLPLRRPMSIAGTDGQRIEIIYKVLGEGTARLSRKKEGDVLNILGPLGNIFDLNHSQQRFPILVGGGIGIAPILFLHAVLDEKDVGHAIIMGALTAEEHFLDHDPTNQVFLTTDDGTKGAKGTVMVAFARLRDQHDNPEVFACGPDPMLKAIHEFLSKHGLEGQMALESYMACGTGLCQGCVIELRTNSKKQHSYQEKYSLVCSDGPVYRTSQIKF